MYKIDVDAELENMKLLWKFINSFFEIDFKNSARNVLDKIPSSQTTKQLKDIPAIQQKKYFYQSELVFFLKGLIFRLFFKSQI
jgi:hypothetical protein